MLKTVQARLPACGPACRCPLLVATLFTLPAAAHAPAPAHQRLHAGALAHLCAPPLTPLSRRPMQEAVVISPRIAFALRPTMGEWYYIR